MKRAGDTPASCGIHPLGSSGEYLYVGMVSRYKGRLLLSRQKGRDTWETQGGHIEPGETPLAAAKRELYEECGALDYTLAPLCDYRARGTSGVLFFADIRALGPLPAGSEMQEVRLFDGLPENLTHPAIARAVYGRAKRFCGCAEGDKKGR